MTLDSDYVTTDEASLRNFPIMRYVHVAIATAWLWDALISFSTETEAFIDRRWFKVDFIYFASRTLTLCVAVCEIIAAVAPLSSTHCNIMVHIISALGTTTTCLGTMLFLARARSVFFHSEWARLVFLGLWCIAVGGVISTTPFSFYGARVKPTDLCIVSKVGKLEFVGSLSVAAFDITVFVTITYRILAMERDMGRWAMLRAFILGSNAGSISRALLRTGQLYFFPMLVLMILLVLFEFSSLVEGEFVLQCRAALYCALAVFHNIMACRVFRLLRLVDPADPYAQTTQVSNLRFLNIPSGVESTFNV
ncbi:hypothetical protein QCA50_005899 [Cerrena zonata]|uniref:DUF6533 domain-containing protein n=1 Tax=Cerrena zonata TaxID=2478898 RepID=A0AAW0GI10_9APHY